MYKYSLYYPAGNTTALVYEGNNLDYKLINDEILAKHSEVEQVGFIVNNELKMAGGEICFNALRCAAKFLLDKNNCNKINAKLNKIEYECGIRDNLFIKEDNLKEKYKNKAIYYTKIPLTTNINKLSDYEYSVDLGDIFHIIYTKKLDINDENIKNFAYEYFKNNSLLDKKAVGFMYLQENILKPVVWVRDIKTLFFESACGSGSFSSFLYFNQFLNKDYIALKQPSNEYLFLEKEGIFISICSIVENVD